MPEGGNIVKCICFLLVVSLLMTIVTYNLVDASQNQRYGGYYILSLQEYWGKNIFGSTTKNLSPLGDSFVYIASGNILEHVDRLWLLNQLGILSYQATDIVISPQGDKVACSLSKGDKYNIAVWCLERWGGFRVVLIEDLNNPITGICWRGDGKELGFMPGEDYPGEVWVTDNDGLWVEKYQLGVLSNPQISPNGRFIAYLSGDKKASSMFLNIYDRETEQVFTPWKEEIGSASYYWLGEDTLFVAIEEDAQGGCESPVGVYILQNEFNDKTIVSGDFDLSLGQISQVEFDSENQAVLLSLIANSGAVYFWELPLDRMELFEIYEVEITPGSSFSFRYIPSHNTIVYDMH